MSWWNNRICHFMFDLKTWLWAVCTIVTDLHTLLFSSTRPSPPSAPPPYIGLTSFLFWFGYHWMWGLPWLGSTSTKKRPQFPVTVHCTRFYAGSDYRFSLLKSILSTLLPHGCLLDKNLDHYGFTRGSVVGIQLLWRIWQVDQQTSGTICFVFYHCNWTTVNTQPQICLIKVHLKTHQSMAEDISIFHNFGVLIQGSVWCDRWNQNVCFKNWPLLVSGSKLHRGSSGLTHPPLSLDGHANRHWPILANAKLPDQNLFKIWPNLFLRRKVSNFFAGEQLTEFTPEFWLFSVGLIPETVD